MRTCKAGPNGGVPLDRIRDPIHPAGDHADDEVDDRIRIERAYFSLFAEFLGASLVV